VGNNEGKKVRKHVYGKSRMEAIKKCKMFRDGLL